MSDMHFMYRLAHFNRAKARRRYADNFSHRRLLNKIKNIRKNTRIVYLDLCWKLVLRKMQVKQSKNCIERRG